MRHLANECLLRIHPNMSATTPELHPRSTNTLLKEMNSFLSTRNEQARKSGETNVYLASSRSATIAKIRNIADDLTSGARGLSELGL
jgi:hypothetical protein